MENYEINVLTRKGGWKKLSQTSKNEELNQDSNKKAGPNDQLSINILDQVSNNSQIPSGSKNSQKSNEETNLFDDFQNINIIINELQNVEKEKQNLIEKLSYLENNFVKKRNDISQKLDKVKKEHELYEKTISLINSLKDT